MRLFIKLFAFICYIWPLCIISLECQRARCAKWQRQKMEKDSEYREEEKRCRKEWQESHSGYWKEYGWKNPDYVTGSRQRQRLRDARCRKDGLVEVLAKMDVITRPHFFFEGRIV